MNAVREIPASDLHFRVGELEEAEFLVKRFHYSRRIPSNVQMVGSLHESGGLFGDAGPMAGACFWTIPGTRWGIGSIIELARLVRRDDVKVPLSRLISLSCAELKRRGVDLVVSFADRTHGHHGGVYIASGWNYDGARDRACDGVIIDGQFIPGRSCNSRFGTRSPDKLKERGIMAEPHFDAGKHLYWRALTKKGKLQAKSLGLGCNPVPVRDHKE